MPTSLHNSNILTSYLFILFVSTLILVPSSALAQNVTTSGNDTITEQQLSLQSKYFSDGNDLFDKGQYQEAISMYDMALAILPNDTDTLYEKGRALNNLGNYTGAISNFDLVLAIDPTYTDALTSKGIALENLGRHNEALVNFDKVLAAQPSDTNAMYRKGLTLQNLTRFTEAISYFDKILSIEPANTDAMYHMGLALEGLGNHTGAISYYDKVLAIDPTNIDVLNSRNLAQGRPSIEESQGSQLDQTILTVVGLFVAIVFVVLLIDRLKKQRHEQIPLQSMTASGGTEFVETPAADSGEYQGRAVGRLAEKTISITEKQTSQKQFNVSQQVQVKTPKTILPDPDAQSLITMIRELEKNQIGNSIMLEMIRKSFEQGRPVNKIEKEYVIKKYYSYKNSQI